MLIAHSWLLKLYVFTRPGTANFFASIGLPGWFANVVFAAQAMGGITGSRDSGGMGSADAGTNPRGLNLGSLGHGWMQRSWDYPLY
jgi:putative oxidoreductase